MDACNLCGSWRWRSREEGRSFHVAECGCGLVFVTPQPDSDVLAGAYDEEYYGAWRPQAPARERVWRRRLRAVEASAGGPGRLLDIGCGTGDFLRLAAARGFSVSGTEISSYAVSAAQAGGLENVVSGEVWDAGFPAASFDVVTCWHVLEHARDPRRVLEEARRILRTGGWLVVATPNLDDRIFRAVYPLVRRRRLRLFDPADREIHLFHFSAPTLRALAESAGFDVEAVGFDRGAAVMWPKSLLDQLAHAWYRLSGIHWGLGLELVARKRRG